MPFNAFNQLDSTGAISVDEFNVGWRNDKKAFYIEDDALSILRNATVDHGEIRKRRNNKTIGTTAIKHENSFIAVPTGVAGDALITFNIKTETSADVLFSDIRKISPYGMSFSIDSNNYVVQGSDILLNNQNVGSVNFSTGAVSINWTGQITDLTVNMTYRYHRLNPVLGISRAGEDGRYLLFDREYAYSYLITQSSQNIDRMSNYASSDALLRFTGTDNDRFYFANYQNVQFVTNGVAGQHFINITGISKATNAVLAVASHNLKVDDVVFINEVEGMTEINLKTANVTATTTTSITVDIDSTNFSDYTTNGVVQTLTQSQSGSGIKYFRNDGFVNFAPPISSNRYLLGCKFLIVFNGILICFGTYEGTAGGAVEYFPLRMRYSAVGNAFYAYESNVFVNSWMDALVGSGGFIDFDRAGEEITYARVIDGFLFVGFRYGFVRASYTFNVEDLFLTYYFPSDLGTESNASAVHMDKYILSFSERGIIATSHDNIQRIDKKIFYASQDLDLDENSKRHVHAIRDTEKEYVYISYKSDDENSNFNDKTLVFNYENNTFALFDERSTAQTNFFDFEGFTFNRLEEIYETFDNVPGSFIDYFSEKQTATTAFATSQGVFIQRTEASEPEENLKIETHSVDNDSNITLLSANNHSAKANDYILMKKGASSSIFKVLADRETSNEDIIVIDTILDDLDGTETFHVLYNFDITTKKFGTFWNLLHKMDAMEQYFLITANKNFTFSVDSFDIHSSTPMLTNSFTVEDRESADTMYTDWVYSTQSVLTSSIQLKLYFSDSDMRNINNHLSDFCLNKFYIIVTPSGHLTYSRS